jgi:hypothetical protein
MELMGSAGSRAESGIPAAWAAAMMAALLAACAAEDIVELGRDRDFDGGGPPPVVLLLLKLAGDSGLSFQRSPLLSCPLPLPLPFGCSRLSRW